MAKKTTQSIENAIKNRLYGKGRGWVFTPKDFSDLGSEDSIWPALSRLLERGFIRRLAQGIYDYPSSHKNLGQLPPDIDAVADAVARKFRIRLQPSGAYAANALGLSEQVPAKITFLTDGGNKTLKLPGIEIRFKKATPKRMAVAGTVSGLVFEALRYIGEGQDIQRQLNSLRKRLSSADKKRLKLDSRLAPAWIAKLVEKEICHD